MCALCDVSCLISYNLIFDPIKSFLEKDVGSSHFRAWLVLLTHNQSPCSTTTMDKLMNGTSSYSNLYLEVHPTPTILYKRSVTYHSAGHILLLDSTSPSSSSSNSSVGISSSSSRALSLLESRMWNCCLSQPMHASSRTSRSNEQLTGLSRQWRSAIWPTLSPRQAR